MAVNEPIGGYDVCGCHVDPGRLVRYYGVGTASGRLPGTHLRSQDHDVARRPPYEVSTAQLVIQ